MAMQDPNHSGPSRRVTGATARMAPEALSEGGPAIPLFSAGARVTDALFGAAGKKASDVESSIDAKCAPASFEVPGVRVELQTVLAQRKRGTSYNVAGLLEGSDPALKAETIVFSGHFDHDGIGTAGIYHGADDNGSGTVGVVNLAHAYAMNPVKPKRSILFIVFAAEERGLLGSYYYVSHPLRPLATTRAQINFDMIGRNEAADPRVITEISPDTSNQLGLIGTHYSPDYRETVERQNKTVGLDRTYKWDLDAFNGILFRSDQYPFLLHDVPAIWWFTGFHPDYHQYTDTVEKINFEKMAKILKLAYLSGFEFADEQNTPRLRPRAKAQ
jgi:Zn-dependent M28 family amino/carboxypeptidase